MGRIWIVRHGAAHFIQGERVLRVFSLVFAAHPVVSCFRSKQWLLSNGVESATGGSVADIAGAALAGIEPILQHVPNDFG